MGSDDLDSDPSTENAPLDGFLTTRRAAGLLGAAVVATVGYNLVREMTTQHAIIFFVIFLVVFGVLNYAVWRYD